MTQANDLVHFVVIMDRSGSMSHLKQDMEGGLREAVEEQKALPGRCIMSLYQFDDEFSASFEGLDIQEVRPEMLTLTPRGGTALNDAIVKALALTEETNSKLNAPPDKTFVCVITDGYENASKEATKAMAAQAIRHATEQRDFQFGYLAADPTSAQYGQDLTVQLDAAAVASVGTYDATLGSAKEAVRRYSYAVALSRVLGTRMSVTK